MQQALEQDYVEYVTARLEPLRRTARLLSGERHLAEDLVQETITRLYVHWRRARAARNLDAYVRTILVRIYLDQRRLAWWSRVHLSAAPPEPESTAPADPDSRLMLRAALKALPPRQRAVLVLRFVCDLPVDEVAELLSCSAGTVKSQTSHGLAALRRQLGEPALADLGKGTRHE
jgi:RNA polymerase sigma-70 factor (sigma-E family)